MLSSDPLRGCTDILVFPQVTWVMERFGAMRNEELLQKLGYFFWKRQ